VTANRNPDRACHTPQNPVRATRSQTEQAEGRQIAPQKSRSEAPHKTVSQVR
jgi:hypothetical protein